MLPRSNRKAKIVATVGPASKFARNAQIVVPHRRRTDLQTVIVSGLPFATEGSTNNLRVAQIGKA